MLSAAAAALVAAGAARAATEISTSTSTPLATASAGDITIDAGGAISISTASTAAATINSGNFLINNGTVANTGVDGAIGVQLDTTAGSIYSPAGFGSTGAINLSGNGASKRGIWITGGNTFYGPITLTSLTGITTTGTATTTQASSISIQGDSSAALALDEGTKVTSNIVLAGSGITQAGSTNSTATGAIGVFLSGTVYGNVLNLAPITSVGAGIIGFETLGGIHACSADPGVAGGTAPSGFSCPSVSGGSLVNAANIQVVGTATPSSRGGNAESGSALIVGGSIDGGFLNNGPSTSSNVTAAVISSAGIIASTQTTPTVLIDPNQSITGNNVAPRGAIILGPVTPDIDSADAGYSFINRGTISAQPLDAQLSSAALVIQGSSATYNTCFSTQVGVCSTTPQNGLTKTYTNANGTTTTATYNAIGGMLITGTVSAASVTNLQTGSLISATAIHIGDFATIPQLDVKAETISGTTTTPGIVSATVSGVGGGSAFGLSLSTNANVPTINVGKGASIVASVQTNTIAPDSTIATSTAPFTLFSEAIVDQSGKLTAINNAGTIQAANTTLTAQTGATVINVTRAIDQQAAPSGHLTINNSGKILGDVLFAPANGGTGNSLLVGNTGGGGVSANTTGVINSPGNYAIVAESIISQVSGFAPSTNAALIDFGSGVNNQLVVGGYGYVNADIHTASAGSLAITVDPNGLLYVASNTLNLPNDNNTLQASTVNVLANGTLGLSITQQNLSALTPVVQANTSVLLNGANLALQFGSYISATNGTPAAPQAQTITLIRSPSITDTTLPAQNAQLAQNTPFLFESPANSGTLITSDNGPTPLTVGPDGTGQQVLQLHLLPRSINAKNADGSPGLNLSGDAANQFPYVIKGLATDPQLGAAVATSMTVYNTPGQPGSGINVAASQQQAEQVFTQFAPDVSGGTREIAIMLTDQATGPVAARQRLLRSYGTVAGSMTLWGEEFSGHINNKGRADGANTLTSYKDRGIGFALGVDAGGPRSGWYGGAFTFYSGDVNQLLPRATRTQTEWYMLTGYTDWHGKHVFLDTQISAAYGNFSESRNITVGSVSRTATSKRPGAMLALGANLGLIGHVLGGVEVDPHVSLDGLTLREEGYTESGGGDGFNLQVAPYFANSARAAIGTDVKGSVDLWGISLTPEGRIGYRYDLLHQPVKIRAGFASTGGLGTTGNTMTFIGPDPDTGNVFTGASFSAGTDTWSLGVNYDWVRGNNGSTTQVGTLTVLGRI
jgi:hypothetical protein